MNNIIRNMLLVFGLGLLVATSVLVWQFDSDILPKAAPKKVGFITLGDVKKPGWNSSHYEGMKKACEQMGIELVYRDKIPENTGDCPRAIESLAAENVGMIFLCSYEYAAEVSDLVKEKYSHIAFATNSGAAHTRNMTAYFARMYQGRYLAGVLAGMCTKSNIIGYVAAIPNSEVCCGINAFALGVRRMNPTARIVVAWTDSWEDPPRERELAERLVQETGADILTYHQDERATAEVAEALGVDFIGYNEVLQGYSEHNLTSVVCRWEVFYADMLKRYLKGELNTLSNTWIGMERQAVGFSDYSVRVTPNMRKTITAIYQEIAEGREPIFSGELYDQAGKLRCRAGETIGDDALREQMEWLLQGVEVLAKSP